MADQPSGSGRSRGLLDANSPGGVVYCHQCANQWYHNEHGLICPNCHSEITEIVSPESDPRPGANLPESPPGYHNPFPHGAWGFGDHPDPEEADIADVEEHVTHGPGGSVFVRQSIRSSTPRGDPSNRPRRDGREEDDPTYVMRDFQSMLGNLMGPGLESGQHGRSSADVLYGGQSPFHATGFRLGGDNGPRVVGGRFTFATGNLRPRDADGGPMEGGPPVEDLATYASSPSSSTSPNGTSHYVVHIIGSPDDVASILGTIFGQVAQPGEPQRENGQRPTTALQGLLASLLNPANARHGDAVYSQEALDQIISTLMEQHPTSNAPGPASLNAIQQLPKRKLDEELLGSEGKGECSVCMDDVRIGDEVVMLPCSHWFHENCASAWLSEHNTCPICRKGIEDDNPSNSGRSSQGPAAASPRSQPRSGFNLTSRSGRDSARSRNEARLSSIRASGRISPPAPEEARRSSNRQGYPGISTHTSHRRESNTSADYPPERDRRANTSGSEESWDSHASSRSAGSRGGPMNWFREHFTSHPNQRRNE